MDHSVNGPNSQMVNSHSIVNVTPIIWIVSDIFTSIFIIVCLLDPQIVKQ